MDLPKKILIFAQKLVSLAQKLQLRGKKKSQNPIDNRNEKRIIKTMENLTNNDIRQLVAYAQSAPEYMSFSKACFVVSQLTNKTTDEIINISKPDVITEVLIDEAFRVPHFVASKTDNNGQIIIF